MANPLTRAITGFRGLPVAQQMLLGIGVPLAAGAALIQNARARTTAAAVGSAAGSEPETIPLAEQSALVRVLGRLFDLETGAGRRREALDDIREAIRNLVPGVGPPPPPFVITDPPGPGIAPDPIVSGPLIIPPIVAPPPALIAPAAPAPVTSKLAPAPTTTTRTTTGSIPPPSAFDPITEQILSGEVTKSTTSGVTVTATAPATTSSPAPTGSGGGVKLIL